MRDPKDSPETDLAPLAGAGLAAKSGALVTRGLEILSTSTLASAIEPLALAIEARSRREPSQVLRIKTYAVALARAIGVSEADIRTLELAALLRNIGMLAFGDRLVDSLLVPESLTREELNEIFVHSEIGAEIIGSTQSLAAAAPLVRHHHERWDGEGYPAGLKATDIPLGARVLATVEYYDALTSGWPGDVITSERQYNKLNREAALKVLQEKAGTAFDPDLVERFAQVLPTIHNSLFTTTHSDAVENAFEKARVHPDAAAGPTENATISNDAQAAEQSDADAQYSLGMDYAYGFDVRQDDAQAAHRYRKAAEQGHASAQYSLGWAYSNGLGVPQDDAQAVQWFRRAAEQGDADAQHSLGWAYTNGPGVSQDDAQAVQWFRKAAEQGHDDAQFNMGWAYANGLGVPKDDTQAAHWFHKACDHDYSRAPRDDAQAVRCYLKAAEYGIAFAQFKLGLLCNRGRGVPEDYVEAHKWMNLAVLHARQVADQKRFADGRDVLAKKMRPEELSEAQKRAKEWTEAFERRKQ